MSEYDLLAGFSNLEEKWILQPRKLVSLRLNLLFCFVAANVSALVPDTMPIAGIVVYIASFGILYAAAFWLINRPKNRRLLIETSEDEKR